MDNQPNNNSVSKEEIGNELYSLKFRLESTLQIMSMYYYKDQRGDYCISTEMKDIQNVANTLRVLAERTNNVLNKIDSHK
jgi:hypothetical protein